MVAIRFENRFAIPTKNRTSVVGPSPIGNLGLPES